MSTPEFSPYQQMANALAGYQRVVAENEIRAEDPDYVQRIWKESEDVVDGLEPFSPDGKMDPAIHKEILDDLTRLAGGHPPEVGHDMTIPRQTLVEQSFRSSMESEIDEALRSTANTLEFRRKYVDKIRVPITSPEWKKAFFEYLESDECAGLTNPVDELSARRRSRLANLSGNVLPVGFAGIDMADVDARLERSYFVVIEGGKQEIDES